ncbi:MAG: endolytic transglycosylase MltG [Oscillospiraceae bacterium]|nr:endolytic transglycosylase MltG [Oscillospiraceae bacterium]
MSFKKKIVLISLMAAVVIILIFIAIMSFDVFGVTGEKEDIKIPVEEGETISEVLSELKDKDIIINELLFKVYLRISGETPMISYGEHTVNSSMSYSEILTALSTYAYKPTVDVRIPENANISNISAILEENGVCSAKDFLSACRSGEYTFSLKDELSNSYKVAYKLEGYLYPDTYTFYRNDEPLRVLNVLLKRTEEIFGADEKARAEELGLTVNEVFTFASVVEGECCGDIEAMPKVAAVFWNRLNDWGKDALLQSDITGNYPFNTEYYNSYTNGGLPPGPINCITEEALKAVLYPDETVSAYYFVTDADMNFYYNDTLTGHNNTINRLKREGKWA